MIEPYQTENLWIVIIGFIVAFLLAYGIGANDVGNSFGTSVGSGALTLFQACVLGCVAETAGALLIGHRITATLRKSIIELSMYEDREKELMLLCVAVVSSTAFCSILASVFGLPISSAHSCVSSFVGCSFGKNMVKSLRWKSLGLIGLSWLLAPIVSGLISAVAILFIENVILWRDRPLRRALRLLPLFYGFTVFLNVFSIVNTGDWVKAVYIAVGCAAGAMILCLIFVIPYQKKKIQEIENDPVRTSVLSLFNVNMQVHIGVSQLFLHLQIITSIFSSFAHGGNDVSYSTGPAIALWSIYSEGSVQQKSQSPYWLLLIAGAALSLGLCTLGYKTITTLGIDLSKITIYSGFAIEIGSASTVLGGTTLGLPTSTTQCKVGSIVFVGLCSRKKNVNWKILLHIVSGWVLTFPIASTVAFIIFGVLRTIAFGKFMGHHE